MTDEPPDQLLGLTSLGSFTFKTDCHLKETLCGMWVLSLAACLRDLCYRDVLQASLQKNLSKRTQREFLYF